jgi:hypothetical protein
MSTKAHDDNGNGHSTDPPRRSRRFPDVPIELLVEDVVTGVELTRNQVEAIARTQIKHGAMLTGLADGQSRLEGGMLELLARVQRVDGDIEQVKRGSKADEYMQKAAEAHLAVRTAAEQAGIDARQKRNAALIKYGVPALMTAVGSIITWLLTRL